MSRQDLLAKIYSELVVNNLRFTGPDEAENCSDVYKENCEALYKIAKIAAFEYDELEYI